MHRSTNRIGLVVGSLTIAIVAGAWTLGSPPVVSGGGALSAATLPDTMILNRYRWRSIGPDRGGRSIAVSGVKGRPQEAYFGATGGGLWKTTNGGTDWTPVTDGLIKSASVGAVAVSESSPDVVYIGMGETCIRGNIMAGDGVYKSTDAGKSWTNIGFGGSNNISKIRIHPTNPNIVYVAAFGKHGADSPERGVFKSTDGGRTWRKVLYRNDKTGAIDLSIDATNPNVMYAAMWEAFRKEYQMSSGGPGSGLFKSTDGGETWAEITRNQGMPSGMVGRIGVSVSPADPRRVYAIVENDRGGLFRSDDAGATWSLVNSGRNIRQRAFYYTHVNADPKNADAVYVLNTTAFRSTDGGKTLSGLGGGTHGDFHDLWINPDNPQHLVIANDGGGAVSMQGGQGWSAQDFPTPQYYRIVATAHQPYHVCGSQQDGSSICLPSSLAGGGGRGGRGGGGAAAPGAAGPNPNAALQAALYSVGGSENGYMAPDPKDPDVFFVGTNANGGGFLNRTNRRTGQTREVSPYPRMFSGEESAVIKERWQWTYPIVFSPVDPNVLYTSSQRLWKTTNNGLNWTAISGDLTRHDPKTMGPSGGPITRDMNGPEVYAVIFAVGPSKKNVNVIWTGSDDGLIHVTRNGGTSWTNVTPKDMPDFGRVSIIDASAFDSATAYAAVKRPLLDDEKPYIFRTRDFGRTWTKIVTGLRADDYVHAVREDPYRRGLLYAATQHGVYISYNDGDSWESLSLNLPDVPVSDLIVERTSLAIATHGRGFYILDDIVALRDWSPAAAAATRAFLFAPAPAIRGAAAPAFIYWVKQPGQTISFDVMDSTGKIIQSFPTPAPAGGEPAGGRGGRGGGGGGGAPSTAVGLNTFSSWSMQYPGATTFPGMILWGGGNSAPAAPPGTYRVRMNLGGGQSQTQNFVIKRNPLHADVTDADLRTQFNLAVRIRDKVSEANQAVLDIRRMKVDVAERLTKSPNADLKSAGDRLVAALSAVEGEIYQVRNEAGQDPLNFPIKINNRLASLLGVVNRGDGRPIGNAEPIFRDLAAELKVLTDRLGRVMAVEMAAFNTTAKAAGVEAVRGR